MRRAAIVAIMVWVGTLFTGTAHAQENDGRFVTGYRTDDTGYGVQRHGHRHRSVVWLSYDGGTVIGGRPAGCPRAYCGCGLARFLGLRDARLNLAWNWARMFPRSHPATGQVVVWRHHVALIEEMVGPGMARLRDYNSGRGLSRIHVRSIRGAVVVNPHVQLAAQ